jgi:hypothetical protein
MFVNHSYKHLLLDYKEVSLLNNEKKKSMKSGVRIWVYICPEKKNIW